MNSKKPPNKPVLLLGSYGRGNLGDDIFTLCAIKLFHKHKIYINSAHDSLLPREAQGKVITVSTVSLLDVIKKFRIFLNISSIVYWGGDLWTLLDHDKLPRK